MRLRSRWRWVLIGVLALGFSALFLAHARLESAHAALLLKQPPVSPLDREYPFIASPNFNWRPYGQAITCIVLHSTAQPDLQATINWFLTPESKVSAHFVVDKDGRVVQMVPVEARAWHAGVSTLDGVAGVNDYSIGIEMVNRNDGLDPYPEAQYQAVARIILEAQALYPIPDSRVVSHASIALPPGRKTDPAGFDWNKLHETLQQERAANFGNAAAN